MHRKFADVFCDPITHESLKLVVTAERGEIVEEGYFESSNNRFPIIRGIPRFAGYDGENYAASFGYRWHKWPKIQFESENIGRPMEGHTTNMWESVVGRDMSVSGKLILDIGCGP